MCPSKNTELFQFSVIAIQAKVNKYFQLLLNEMDLVNYLSNYTKIVTFSLKTTEKLGEINLTWPTAELSLKHVFKVF